MNRNLVRTLWAWLFLTFVLFAEQAWAATPSVSAGSSHSCAVLSSGAVQCWGNNDTGQLGNGSTTTSTIPVNVSGISKATSVSAGYVHSCAVLSSGAVQCWGNNDSGQLGNGTTANSTIPVTVAGISNATTITVGHAHTCALLGSGATQCWGNNAAGQLGNGTTTTSNSPVAVTGISDATSISAGYAHTCALLSSGTVQCWGANNVGQLGNGTTTNSNIPVSVSGISNAISISAGGGHTCAVLSSRAVKCWGNNGDGQLGNDKFGQSTSSPVVVSGISNASSVSTGQYHSCAVLSSGAVQCWGDNSYGRLGINSSTSFSGIPVTVNGIANATSVSAGYSHSCAVLSSGAVQCWGDNFIGQLGNGTTDSAFPGQVLGTNGQGFLNLGTTSNTSVAWLNGTWLGQAAQSGYPDFSVKLTATNGDYKIEYPSLSCGGTLTLLSTSTNSANQSVAAFREKITFDNGQANCVDGGKVELTQTGSGAVKYVYYLPNGNLEAQGALSLSGTYILSTSKTGTGQGSISSSPTGITCGSDCTETYASGTSVTLTAAPAANNRFVGWSGACSGTSLTCSMTMNANKIATAEFAVIGACEASDVVSINSSAYAVGHGYEAFDVICGNGRYGVVRLPRTTYSLDTRMQRACAYQQSSCSNTVSKCADPAPTTAALAAVADARTSGLALLTQPVINSLAGWICQ
jgi:alpha-tubulin suppressor-like RCC1 family protein